MGQVTDARRQWIWTTRRMNNRDLAVAAVIAQQWGWHDRAILTVAKSDHQDDLELRFPLLYRDVIEANATESRHRPQLGLRRGAPGIRLRRRCALLGRRARADAADAVHRPTDGAQAQHADPQQPRAC